MSEFVKWLLVGFIALNAIATITLVGKPRGPMTPGIAAACVVTNALMIAAILAYWGGPS